MSRNAGVLAVVYAEVCGSSLLQASLPASEADYAMGRCEKRILQTCEGYGGHGVKHGETTIAFFTDNQSALQAAVDVQRRVAALPPTAGVSLAVRVGVCVGHKGTELSFFTSKDASPAAALGALAQPGQLLLSVPMRVKGIEWSEIVAHRLPELSISCGNRKLRIFDVDWRHCDAQALRPIESDSAERPQLFLRFDERDLLLDYQTPSLTIGRQSDCGLHLNDKNCSRLHAAIELRGERFVLIDKSTNGTFVTIDGERERRLHRKEVLLSGRGRISFGGPAAETDDFCLHFRQD